MNKKSFGQFLAQTRKARNMTQQDLAQQLHVTNTAVSKWERGLSYPDLSLFEPLSQVLGLTVAELMACQKEVPVCENTWGHSIRSLLDIVLETARQQRRKWLLYTALLVAAVLITGSLVFYFTVLSVYDTSTAESPVIQTDHGGHWVFLEKDGGLLKLKCDDPSLSQNMPPFPTAHYLLEYRYNKNTWEGELLSYTKLEGYLGTPTDTVGSSFFLDGNVLGLENVICRIDYVRTNPHQDGHYLYSYRYYTVDPQDPSLEYVLAQITDCRHQVAVDYDGDGITELWVLTGYRNQTYQIYDLENGQIVSRFTDKIPEEIADMLLPSP